MMRDDDPFGYLAAQTMPLSEAIRTIGIASVCSSPPCTCKHCGRGTIPGGGAHWCPGSAKEAEERAISDAIALLERNGYDVSPRDAAPDPWRFEAES
jgi:hypothetical protein